MYDELVKRMWECASGECFNCSQYTPTTNASVCQKELMKQAADAIEELSKPKWIPVEERLPEEDGRYLTIYPLKTKPSVLRHEVYGFAKDLVEVDKYDFNEHKPGFYGYDDEYGYYEDKDVTHWMPLPTPPTKGE